MSKNILLVEPSIPKKWGANNQFVGLLKIGAWAENIGNNVEYVVAPNLPSKNLKDIVPDEIYITSLFTYWWEKTHDAVKFYKSVYPTAKVMMGGIYASLCPEFAAKSGAEIIVGQHPEAKNVPPNPLLLPKRPDFVYTFTASGCSGCCSFCGTPVLYKNGLWQREVGSVLDEIELQKKRGFNCIKFGDDNLLDLAETHIIPIMEGIIRRKLKMEFEVSGGMQARHVTPQIAKLLKKSGFTKLSLGFESTNEEVLRKMGRKQLGGVDTNQTALQNLEDAGFNRKEITVFILIGLPFQTLDDMMDSLIYGIKSKIWILPQRWSPIPGSIDYKRYNCDRWDLKELYYKTFIHPDCPFTSEDLNFLYDTARFFNIARLYTNNGDRWIHRADFLKKMFKGEAVEEFCKKLETTKLSDFG